MLNCLSNSNCSEGGDNCFTEYFNENAKVDSTIAALAIIENDSPPSVGDSITLSTSITPVVLTDCNYIDSLLQWVRDKQYSCDFSGKYYHFFKTGVISKGTRAKATDNLSEDANYLAPTRKDYSTTAMLKIDQHYVPNIDFLEDIKDRASSLSIIYFFKQGGLVLDSNKDYTVYISNSGFEVTGSKGDYIAGEIDLSEKGKRQPTFYYAEKASDFIKALKASTEFTFGVPTITGITEQACGSQNGCKAYKVAPTTAWSYQPDINELVSCGTYELYKDCDTTILPAGVTLNPITGKISSTGLAAGDYKFTMIVKNSCCVKGSFCFIVNVAAVTPVTPV